MCVILRMKQPVKNTLCPAMQAALNGLPHNNLRHEIRNGVGQVNELLSPHESPSFEIERVPLKRTLIEKRKNLF